MPFGLLSLPLANPWLAVPLSLLLAGVFILMAVTGAANDEPFAGSVTDVAVATISRDIQRDMNAVLGDPIPPSLPSVSGYAW